MPPRQASIFRITRQEQIEALSSPVRLEVMDAVRVLGRCSVSDIAQHLGRAPSALYYHVDQLVDVGLLVPCGERETARRKETIYMTPGKRLRTPFDQKNTRQRANVLEIYKALLRLTERDFTRAVKNGLAIFSGRKRNIRHGRIKGWLTEDDLRDVQAHMDAIVDIIESEKAADGEDTKSRALHAVTMFLVPIQPRRQKR